MLSPWVQFVPIKLAAVEEWNFLIKLSRTVMGFDIFASLSSLLERQLWYSISALQPHTKNVNLLIAPLTCLNLSFFCFVFLQIKVPVNSWYLLLVFLFYILLLHFSPSENSVVLQRNRKVVFTFLNKSWRLKEIPRIPIIQYLLHLHRLFFLQNHLFLPGIHSSFLLCQLSISFMHY